MQLLGGRATELQDLYFKTPGGYVFTFTKRRYFNSVDSRRCRNQRNVFRTFGSVRTVKLAKHFAGRGKDPHHHIDAELVNHKLQKLILLQANGEAMTLAASECALERDTELE